MLLKNKFDLIWFETLPEEAHLIRQSILVAQLNYLPVKKQASKSRKFLIAIKTTFQSLSIRNRIILYVIHCLVLHNTLPEQLCYTSQAVVWQCYSMYTVVWPVRNISTAIMATSLQCHHHCQALEQWFSAVSDKSRCCRLEFVQRTCHAACRDGCQMTSYKRWHTNNDTMTKWPNKYMLITKHDPDSVSQWNVDKWRQLHVFISGVHVLYRCSR